ncbi:hypothetical protein ABPG72_010055 [Tetrahymena utriculariae]
MKLFSQVNRFAFLTANKAASPLAAQLAINGNRNAIRYENQNRTWTFDELDAHTNAFAYGLTELGWKAGDKLLLWVEKNHTSEITTAQVGAAKAGVTLVPIYAHSAEELEKALNDTKAKGLLLSPNSKAGNSKYIEVVNKVIPELYNTGRGSTLKTKFANLQHIIHTGFYTFPGTYKFRQIMVYASKNFNTLTLPNVELNVPLFISGNQTYTLKDLIAKTQENRKTSKLNDNTPVFVTGDSRSPLSFSLGVLNSLLYGNYSVYTGAQDLNEVGQTIRFYDNALLLVDGDIVKATQSLKHSENFAKIGGVAGNENIPKDSLNQLFGGKLVQQLKI